jgi:signal-induced proliferation-associated 1 like protein 3
VLPEVVPVVVVPVVAPEVVPEVVVPVVVEPLVEVPEVLVPVVVVPASLPEVELAGVSVLVLVQEERAAPALKRRATTRMVQAEFLVCFIGMKV